MVEGTSPHERFHKPLGAFMLRFNMFELNFTVVYCRAHLF